MTTTPSRRTVLRTAAWTAPAIAVVAAAPAHAVSTPGPTGFRVNATATAGFYTAADVRWLNIGVSNPTAGSLAVTVFIPSSADPVPWEVDAATWSWLGWEGSSYRLSTTVAPSSDSETFLFAWLSDVPVAKSVTITAIAPGLDPAVGVFSLPFDQPALSGSQARRRSTSTPARSPLLDH